jgi:hypothetical protein
MFLQNTFIYFVAAFSSIVIFFLGIAHFGMKKRLLPRAIRDVVQCVGAFLAFFALNFTIGAILIFTIRGVWRFFPLYTLADAALLIVSAVQGCIFQLWWRLSHQQQS